MTLLNTEDAWLPTVLAAPIIGSFLGVFDQAAARRRAGGFGEVPM